MYIVTLTYLPDTWRWYSGLHHSKSSLKAATATVLSFCHTQTYHTTYSYDQTSFNQSIFIMPKASNNTNHTRS